MASSQYSAVKSALSNKLFGADIAVGNMTAEQRKLFQQEFDKYASSLPKLQQQEFRDQLSTEINANPLPGSRGVTPYSGERAAVTGQIRDATAAANATDQRLIADYTSAGNLANQIDTNAIGSLTSAQDTARQGYANVAGQQRQTANDYNNLSAQLFGGYAQGQAGLNAQDQSGYDRYISETTPLMTRQTARSSDPADLSRQLGAYNAAAGMAGGSLDYSAAQYASNPADIARQTQSYNQLYGAGQGSLDYTAAQWQSNPADLSRQLQGYSDLRGIGQGSLDYTADNWVTKGEDESRQLRSHNDFNNIANGVLDYDSQAARAFADPQDRANQEKALLDIKNDLQFGGKDQREVMEKFKALSDPAVTGKERFLSELARREFETQDKSSRDAVSANLAARGMRSGGQLIAGQQAAHQQISQDRLLKELGIQAQAVDRSMQALGGWGSSANALRSGDQNALNMQAGLSTALRNASFDEAYKRGIGADTASQANQGVRLAGYQGKADQANIMRGQNDQVGMFNSQQNNVAKANNQGTRLAGYQSSAQQSNAIRNSNDAVGTFNVGQRNTASANNQATRLGGMTAAASQSNSIRSANDAVGTFNVGQTNIAQANNQSTRAQGVGIQAAQSNAIRSANDSQRQYEDTFSQNESTRVGNLAGQRAQTGLATTAQIGGRQSDVQGAGQNALDAAYGRTSDANKTDWQVVGNDYGMSKDYFDAVTGAGQNRVDRASGTAGLGLTANSAGTDRLIKSLGIQNDQWIDAEERALAGL
jgi:hypothetical protein